MVTRPTLAEVLAYRRAVTEAVIAALPPLILALTIQRYLVRGLSFGAVKA